MSITFQCEHCEKEIQVADELGGQMGECPQCGHGMYVPLANGAESEALELTEIDVAEEARMHKEMEQTRETMKRIWSDRRTAEPTKAGKERSAPAAPRSGRKVKPIDPEDAGMTVEQYVVAMAWSSLDEAEAMAAHLVGNPQIVNPIIKKALTERFNNESLKNVPDAVQKGFLKKLFEYLN